MKHDVSLSSLYCYSIIKLFTSCTLWN